MFVDAIVVVAVVGVLVLEFGLEWWEWLRFVGCGGSGARGGSLSNVKRQTHTLSHRCHQFVRGDLAKEI